MVTVWISPIFKSLIFEDMLLSAKDFGSFHSKSNILLKGNTTFIGSNKKIIKNTHSSSELAIIGSGDVLAGIIASLVGDNKMSIIEAAAAAAWLHGDIARKYGKGLISEDLIKGIQPGLNRLAKK